MTREQKIIQINAYIIIALGVIFAMAALPSVYQVMKVFFTVAHWPMHDAATSLDATGRLMIAIGGGLTVGFGMMGWSVARYVLPVAPREGRKVIMLTTLGWFVTDSTFSVVAGSPFNVVLNVSFVALMLLPSLNKGATEAAPARS